MRRWVRVVVAAGFFAACGVGAAQTVDGFEPLQRGDLTVWIVSDRPDVESARRQLGREFDQQFRDNKIDFTLVAPEDFYDGLKDSAGTEDSPDVVFGLPPQPKRRRATDTLALDMIVPPPDVDQLASSHPNALGDVRGWVIMRGARHPMAARAFVTWLSERGWKPEPVGKWTTDEEQATAVAMAAVNTTLTGGSLGIIADEDMARFKGSVARAEALGGSGAELTSSVLAVAANERLAAVAVRTRAEAGSAFGIVHSLVILRWLTDRWQVLQVTPSVGTVELAARFAQLRLACRVVDEVAGVGEVSLASPVDGESRVSPFELWWDNGAGAQLLIVEWQQPVEGPPSRLYFLPDREPREKTRIVSPFGGGGLRWRVWAVGKGGALTLSRWRDMR